MDKVLMHTCCAPCSVACVDQLRKENIEPVSFWYNPNIHPYMEYKARRDTLREFASYVDMELIIREDYGLRQFVRAVSGDLDHRCRYCYTSRMAETARYAKEHGFDAFTSTLLISPYQQHEYIRELGEKLAEQYGLTFLYRDFRPFFRIGQDKAHRLGLYTQKYCGCVFSEEERYEKQILRDQNADWADKT